MAFRLSQLIIESILRAGQTSVRRDPSLIPDVFSDLTQPYLAKKYGQKEINKIQNLMNKDIPIVHAFSPTTADIPCISIQLLSSREPEKEQALNDYIGSPSFPMDALQLAQEVIVANITALSYDPLSGAIYLPDSVDLTNVYVGSVFHDVAGNDFSILGGIVDEDGMKQIVIDMNQTVELSGLTLIKSFVNTNDYTQRINVERETLLLGIHTKDPLQTVYLYTLVKYFLEARKGDLIDRGFDIPNYESSDFTRNMDYEADMVFSRFITVTGRIENRWLSEKVIPIEQIELDLEVPIDVANNEQLGLTNSTIKVDEDDHQ